MKTTAKKEITIKPSKWVYVARFYFVMYLLNVIFLSIGGFILVLFAGWNILTIFVFLNVLFGLPLLYIIKDYISLKRFGVA